MARALVRLGGIVPVAALAGLCVPAPARQDAPAPAVNRTEASQIALPAQASSTGPGRAYLDESGVPAVPAAPRDSLVPDTAERLSPADSTAPARQISALADSGPGMAQLSRADLDATLAQLSAGERRVLLEAIEGSDICNDPPRVAAIMALCQTRIETRSGEFTARPEVGLSAEDRLLRGDLESSSLPTLTAVIDRLGRGGASIGDPSNQAIAAIALGTGLPPQGRTSDEDAAGTAPQVGEETQALINALVGQLGGGAP
ncbi:MAG: hypothetical protein NBV68_08380 [Erythrobacter sp.]|uniref:hypothetical protein n=1 Tax=Erythrobacter sp. TaxID=1042 RepID=UPI0025CE7386|nr:hypothetical protein [Erythrobacter sp.]MCL9999384.1 hypothetical protein [Erythrobacter sp.]